MPRTFQHLTTQLTKVLNIAHCVTRVQGTITIFSISNAPVSPVTQILPQERVSKWFPSSSFLSQPAMENSPKNSAPIFLQKLSSHISSILDPIIFQYLF